MWGQMLMASKPSSAPSFVVSISDQNIDDTALVPTTATAGYRLGTDGVAYSLQGGSTFAIADQWLNPDDATEADLYECMAELISGSLTTGSVGVWIPLTSDVDWSRARIGVPGSVSAVIRVKIRLASVPDSILDTAVITLTATVESGA